MAPSLCPCLRASACTAGALVVALPPKCLSPQARAGWVGFFINFPAGGGFPFLCSTASQAAAAPRGGGWLRASHLGVWQRGSRLCSLHPGTNAEAARRSSNHPATSLTPSPSHPLFPRPCLPLQPRGRRPSTSPPPSCWPSWTLSWPWRLPGTAGPCCPRRSTPPSTCTTLTGLHQMLGFFGSSDSQIHIDARMPRCPAIALGSAWPGPVLLSLDESAPPRPAPPCPALCSPLAQAGGPPGAPGLLPGPALSLHCSEGPSDQWPGLRGESDPESNPTLGRQPSHLNKRTFSS